MTIQELHKLCAVKGLVAVFSVMGRRPEIEVEVEQVDRFSRRKTAKRWPWRSWRRLWRE